ncbi:MAG: hypothetical protein IPO49_09955 [Bacteroidetes bacterium]|nr:hypothetical protein [Bacteroidota bacterium]
MDLLHTSGTDSTKLFDGIIADVPCTGSGTWTRTPESLTGFDPEMISKHFVPLQRKNSIESYIFIEKIWHIGFYHVFHF